MKLTSLTGMHTSRRVRSDMDRIGMDGEELNTYSRCKFGFGLGFLAAHEDKAAIRT